MVGLKWGQNLEVEKLVKGVVDSFKVEVLWILIKVRLLLVVN